MARTRHTRVASRSVLGKRSRAGNPTRPFKRRRTNRRRNSTVSTKSSTGGNLTFKARRLSRRRWNSMLWNSTLQKSHYRSVTSQQTLLNSPTNPANIGIIMLDAIQNGAPFWTAGGGAQPIDAGVVVPGFSGDIILRGGKLGISFCNTAADPSPLKCEIFLIKAATNGSSALVPGGASAGWDPSLIPDFRNNVGSIKLRRRFMLENSNAVSFEHRLSIQKIDTDDWSFALPLVAGGKWYWILTIQNLESVVSAGATCVRYHNLSFSGDAV